MGFWDSLKQAFGGDKAERLPPADQGHSLDELARRLGVAPDALLAFKPAYRQFTIAKRTGGRRTITAPDEATKDMQRRILHRLLAKLHVHPAAMGFEKGKSIATHALLHSNQAVVVRMDIRDFFPSTTSVRIAAYFRRIGWNQQAADTLVRLCTHEGGLPQGAPTSPRLANLVNYRLDTRLHAAAAQSELVSINPRTLQRVSSAHALPAITYSRYADDLTFSFACDDRDAVQSIIRLTKLVVRDEGYRLHTAKKLRIMRRHDRQIVTGLVVNQRVALPRHCRRWLRAVDHHQRTGQPATLTPQQLAGWRALQAMIQQQTAPAS
ncbi:MAG: reverse transcriptase family protein [Phycisphaeraceae bacterium]